MIPIEIQSGHNTHTHGQLITPHSLSAMNKSVTASTKPMPLHLTSVSFIHKSCSQHIRHRKQVWRFICRIAKHHALVSGTSLVNTLCDIRRLL